MSGIYPARFCPKGLLRSKPFTPQTLYAAVRGVKDVPERLRRTCLNGKILCWFGEETSSLLSTSSDTTQSTESEPPTLVTSSGKVSSSSSLKGTLLSIAFRSSDIVGTAVVRKGWVLTVEALIVPRSSWCVSSIFSRDTFLTACKKCSKPSQIPFYWVLSFFKPLLGLKKKIFTILLILNLISLKRLLLV